MKNSRRSTKCGCNAYFTFKPSLSSLVFKTHKPGQPHHPACCQLSEVEFFKKANIYKGNQTPEKIKASLEFVTSMYSDDYSTKDCTVTNLLNGQMRREKAAANNGLIPPGTPFAAPKAYTDTLIRAGKAAANGNVSPADAVAALLAFLDKEEMKYRVQNDTDVNGCDVISAIVFHDEVLAPTMAFPCSVYTADVTFGLTDSSCGFAKWFFLSRLLAGKKKFFNTCQQYSFSLLS